LQIVWRGANQTAVEAQFSRFHRAVRQLAQTQGQIEALPDKIDIAIDEADIDGDFRMLLHEKIKQWNKARPSQIQRGADMDGS
jgi:hypothetical protein